mmetsp:Transcript_9644/g.18105  ORF Transcript_9644/g.18105 Transcript_9644/m.18105 type:complete len:81 (+) Transcript_9644:281-523(+)
MRVGSFPATGSGPMSCAKHSNKSWTTTKTAQLLCILWRRLVEFQPCTKVEDLLKDKGALGETEKQKQKKEKEMGKLGNPS